MAYTPKKARKRAKAANLAARFHPITDPHPDASQLPAIETAGAMAFLYVNKRDGALRLSLDFDTVEGWLVRDDHTIPVKVTINGHTVFDDTDGAREGTLRSSRP